MTADVTADRTAGVTAVAAELVDAFGAGDWPRFRATLHPDVVYEETGTQRRTEGADAYVQLCQGWKEGFPDARGTVRRAVASGETVAQEVVWEGTQRGPLAGPGGPIPASGRPIRMLGTMWYAFADGRVREIHSHLDLLALLQQVGALATPAADDA